MASDAIVMAKHIKRGAVAKYSANNIVHGPISSLAFRGVLLLLKETCNMRTIEC